MRLTDHVVVAWTDREPVADRLVDTIAGDQGRLLAAGPVHDVSESDSRPPPSGVVVACFPAAGQARSWVNTVGDQLDGTVLLVAGATDPVWWPTDREPRRPDWSRQADFPADRLGLFVSVWAEITDPAQFFDYSRHYRWTVEYDGGVVLVPGARPSQELLRGGPGPHAMALMAWPADERARHRWYHGGRYRPYRDQRHRSSRTTNVSVRALTPT